MPYGFYSFILLMNFIYFYLFIYLFIYFLEAQFGECNIIWKFMVLDDKHIAFCDNLQEE